MTANSQRNSVFFIMDFVSLLLLSRISCLSLWATQNFPASLTIELYLEGKKTF